MAPYWSVILIRSLRRRTSVAVREVLAGLGSPPVAGTQVSGVVPGYGCSPRMVGVKVGVVDDGGRRWPGGSGTWEIGPLGLACSVGRCERNDHTGQLARLSRRSWLTAAV